MIAKERKKHQLSVQNMTWGVVCGLLMLAFRSIPRWLGSVEWKCSERK
jgi:hypothetical protein